MPQEKVRIFQTSEGGFIGIKKSGEKRKVKQIPFKDKYRKRADRIVEETLVQLGFNQVEKVPFDRDVKIDGKTYSLKVGDELIMASSPNERLQKLCPELEGVSIFYAYSSLANYTIYCVDKDKQLRLVPKFVHEFIEKSIVPLLVDLVRGRDLDIVGRVQDYLKSKSPKEPDTISSVVEKETLIEPSQPATTLIDEIEKTTEINEKFKKDKTEEPEFPLPTTEPFEFPSSEEIQKTIEAYTPRDFEGTIAKTKFSSLLPYLFSGEDKEEAYRAMYRYVITPDYNSLVDSLNRIRQRVEYKPTLKKAKYRLR